MGVESCRTFSEAIAWHAGEHPQRVFVHDVRSGRDYRFAEFDAGVSRTAAYLRSLGLRPGDRITAVIENSPEFCLFYFGAIRAGIVFNPMPFTSHKEEVLRNGRLVEPRRVFVDERKAKEFSAAECAEAGIVFVPVGAERRFEAGLPGLPAGFVAARVADHDPACLYYSSGTTADPKGVLYSHRNMVADISSICRGFHFRTEGEVHLVMLPLGHTASTNYSMLPCAWVGGKMVMAESFWHIRNRIWALVEEHRATYMEVVPTVLYSLLNLYRAKPAADLSSMRFVGCGSAPLQKAIQAEFQARFGLPVANLYGLSETGPTHIDDPLAPGWTPGSIGVPLDVNEVRIVDESDRELPAGAVGEIVVRGENVFVGYFRNPEHTRRVVRDGWFHTGDLGYRDPAGRFFFVDRSKDLIIKGGMNIVPGEIDEVLMMHPGVREGATVGVPDEMFGEEVKCFVVPRDGARLDAGEILRHCAAHLPRTKQPKYVEIVADIPKTHSGKLLRKQLREREAQAGNPEGSR